mmetsp:Transcript_13587/g.15472  ORF Transcript_13587/g.15472 Transcript_13587/m.15472 type:complete len:99 (+) Transcript_13587:992-1288(+)
MLLRFLKPWHDLPLLCFLVVQVAFFILEKQLRFNPEAVVLTLKLIHNSCNNLEQCVSVFTATDLKPDCLACKARVVFDMKITVMLYRNTTPVFCHNQA